MKKKLSCLLIALAMLAGMSSCGDGSAGIDTSANTKYNMTLTLWLPTSEDTTDEAVEKVEAAINKITKKNYKTAIDITAVPDDKYDEAIKKKVLEVEEAAKRTAAEEAERKRKEKEAKKKGETLPPESTEATTIPETVTGEDGSIQEYYPSAKADQLDIFCIRGYDDFAFYAENGYLAPLDESLDASSKLIKSYVYPTFLEWGKIPGDSTTYAIPNNHVIGEYTYLLLNKEMCTKLYYDPSELTSLLDCQQFIEDIGATQTGITPLLNSSYAIGMNFWNANEDPDTFSVLGTIISDDANPTSRHNIRNVFVLKQFNNTMIMMKELQEKGYVGKNADPDSTKFGVGIVSCQGNEIEKYADDYYYHVIQRPRAETDDIYQSMFGVCLNSIDESRSMEILTLINTDPTVRTILQYGVEGIHWDYMEDTEETCIEIISDDYKMNLVETGNVFMTYPGEGIPMSYWEAGKQQNLDSKINPFFGFSGYINEESQPLFDSVDKLSDEMFKKMEAMSAEEFEASVEDMKDYVSNVGDFADFIDENVTNGLVFQLATFHETMYGKPQQ